MCVCIMHVSIRVQQDTKCIIIHANHIACTQKTVLSNKLPNSITAYKITKKYELKRIRNKNKKFRAELLQY